MSEFEWIAEDREVPALKRVLKTGETFEASSPISDDLVAQGLARPKAEETKARQPKKKASGDPAED